MRVSKDHGSGFRRGRWVRRALAVLAVAVALGVPLTALPASANAAVPTSATASADATGPDTTVTPSDWTSGGGNASDTHDSSAETSITPSNVSGLQEKWSYTTTGDVQATPAVVNGVVYVPDLGGSLSAVSEGTGAQLWQRPISDYTGIAGDTSRDTPAYWEGEIVLGDGDGEAGDKKDGAYVFGVDATTGAKLWSTQVDSDPDAIITGSPVISDGIAYVGVSSLGEEVPGETFRGSVVALNAATGAVLWQTYTVPEGYTGGAVWGSTPVVDAQTGLVYVGTGNNYTTPAGVCGSPTQTGCTAPATDDYFDSILAFNASTGAIEWGTHTLTADTFTIDPATPSGVDGDFGADPNLITATVNGQQTQMLVIGQKTGNLWALNPTTGSVIWDTPVGPGGLAGGLHWGTASDGTRIYVADTNYDNVSTTITSATGQTSTITSGFWAAVDPATGKILWETAVPSGDLDPYSFVSAANGVMYSGTLNPTGDDMYAINGATGAIEWGFPSGGSVVAGAAISDGNVVWGTGYSDTLLGFPFDGTNDKLYDFTLPQPAPAPTQVYVSTSGTAGATDTSCASAGYTSINAAIDAVASGGTVTVCGGTYTQEADVTKPVTLTVSGNVIINATGLLHGIDILAPDVTVAGFTINDAIAEGILVDNVANATVETNIVTDDDQGAGISPYYGQCTTGREDCGGGIHLLSATDATVSGNTVSGDASGIVVSDETGPATGNTITSNSVLDNAWAGIILAGDNPAAAPSGTPAPAVGGVYSNTIGSNTAEDNGTADAGGGIVLTSAVSGGAVYGNTITGDILSDNAGPGVIAESLTADQDFNGNQITAGQIGTNNTAGDPQAADTQTTGILVTTVSPLSITITDNTIGTDQIGIWLAGPVTAAGAATGNTFSGVTTPVSTQ
jgi:parallel beta-helix repeat protein